MSEVRPIEKVKEIIEKVLEEYGISEEIELKVPPKQEWGDLSFPYMKFVKKYNVPEEEFVQKLKEALEKLEEVEKVDFLRGNVNIFLNWEKISREFLKDLSIESFKRDFGKGRLVVIDYFSPNVGKMPHFGNLRSGVIGAAMRNILEFLGYKVYGVNFWGDMGTQFGSLICAFKMWGNFEELKKKGIKYLMELYVRFHEEKEKNPELWEKAKEEYKKIEEGDEENLKLLRLFKDMMIEKLKKTWYKWFNLKFEEESGESFYVPLAKEIVRELLGKGVAFEDEEGVVRAKVKGEPVLLKKDGTTIYLSRDLAAAKYHFEKLNFEKKYYVVGNEQSEHFEQLKEIVKRAGWDFSDRIVHYKFGLLLVKVGGKVQKMSTRKGTGVSTEEVIRRTKLKVKRIIWKNKRVPRDKVNEVAWKVALGAIKYFILRYDPKRDIIFEWDKVLNFEGDSGPYIMYTIVRAKSILRKVENVDYDFEISEISKEERELLRKFLELNNVIERLARSPDPNILADYLLDICDCFNKFYEKHRVLQEEDENKKKFRIALVKAFKKIAEGVAGLLNIEVPEWM